MLSEEQREKLDHWLQSLLWEGSLIGINTSQQISIHRTKGRIVMQNYQEWILQGVRELYEFKYTGQSQGQTSKVVFIGEGLEKSSIGKSLQMYVGIEIMM
jgi:Cobalamin synthesis protein cobW C-terminal domain